MNGGIFQSIIITNGGRQDAPRIASVEVGPSMRLINVDESSGEFRNRKGEFVSDRAGAG
jgi:hypothetical protein